METGSFQRINRRTKKICLGPQGERRTREQHAAAAAAGCEGTPCARRARASGRHRALNTMARGRVSNACTWPSLQWARKARAIWATGSGRWTSTCWRRRSNPACRRALALTAVVATRGDPRQRALDRHLLAGVDNRLASAAQPERSHSHAADRSGAMEHPRSPPFDSHVLARRSSATTVATAATGDASTMTALRTDGGPRFGLAAHSTPTHVHAALAGEGGRGRGGGQK